MTITYKQYLIFLTLTALLSLIIVASVNYRVDPGIIYHDDDSKNKFAYRLVKSSSGLLWPNNSWNERDIKSSLAKNNIIGTECAVIGSSHIMQISSFRSNASLKNICPSIINLGVAGGTLEDYLAFSYMLINKNNKPKTIVFGIDPWAMGFYRDSRWERYKQSYYLMRSLLEKNTFSASANDSKFNYIINLINPQYFYRSLQSIGRVNFEIKKAPEFDLQHGIQYPVLLPDGSLAYSKKYISDSNSLKIPIGGLAYKIKNNSQYSNAAVLLFEKLVHLLHSLKINVVFLMTPYHHNVWKDKHAVTTQALLEMEPLVRNIGKKLNVKVLGSYNPSKIGCNPDEFYDQMHAKKSCLAKIKN